MRDLWLSLHASFGFGIDRFSCSLQADSSTGHAQQEHETRHGSMSRTRWAIDGPEGIASSWTGVSSHQTTTVLRCCAIWYARRWGDTCTSTTVVVNHMIIPKSCTSMREWSRTPTKPRTGSHTAFTGVEWVSSSRDTPF